MSSSECSLDLSSSIDSGAGIDGGAGFGPFSMIDDLASVMCVASSCTLCVLFAVMVGVISNKNNCNR
jgi:hypothetical protein